MNEFLAQNSDRAIRLGGTILVPAAALILSAVGRRVALATFDE